MRTEKEKEVAKKLATMLFTSRAIADIDSMT